MINNTKFILLQLILFVMFPVSSLGQNEIEVKKDIKTSLDAFMAELSDVNDEFAPVSPSTIASDFSGNYFSFNGRDTKMIHFVDAYRFLDLQSKEVNHALVYKHEGIVKFNNDKADKRWSVKATLKREYASNSNLKIKDVDISFIVCLNNNKEYVDILEIAFDSKPRTFTTNSDPNEDLNMGPIEMEVPPSPGDVAAMTYKYPFSARVFIPGMAQLHKGSTGKGIAFIVGEALAVGGVVAFEGLRSSYKAKINTTHDAKVRQDYIDKTNNMQNLRNGFIAGALAVYAWNVVDGIVAKGKRHLEVGHVSMRFAPFATPEAGGLAMNINF